MNNIVASLGVTLSVNVFNSKSSLLPDGLKFDWDAIIEDDTLSIGGTGEADGSEVGMGNEETDEVDGPEIEIGETDDEIDGLGIGDEETDDLGIGNEAADKVDRPGSE